MEEKPQEKAASNEKEQPQEDSPAKTEPEAKPSSDSEKPPLLEAATTQGQWGSACVSSSPLNLKYTRFYRYGTAQKCVQYVVQATQRCNE